MSRRAWLSGGARGLAAPALLAACGQAGAPAVAPGRPPAPARVSGTPEFWHYYAGYIDGYQTLTDEFNARQTGVTVNYVPGANQDYWNKLTAALAGNVGPDVFVTNGVNAPAWAYRKQFRDLIWDGKVPVRDGLTKMQTEVNALFERSAG